jgi:hypothetical protein
MANYGLLPHPPAIGVESAYALTNTEKGAEVCGRLSANQRWARAVGVYVVTCDVYVSTGASLEIEAGVTVRFQHVTDDMLVSGELRAAGTADDPVVFQPLAGTTSGSWGRIAFLPGSSGSLDHTRLEYGGYEDGMLYLGSERVQIVDSVVQYSADTGIVIQTPAQSGPAAAAYDVTESGSDAAMAGLEPDNTLYLPIVSGREAGFAWANGPVISRTQVLSNTGVYGGGLYNGSGSPLIQDNTFAGNTVDGSPWERPGLGAGLYNLGTPVIRNNTFRNNGKHGLYAAGGGLYNAGSPLIEGNIFSGNIAGYRTSGGAVYTETGSPTLVDNTLSDNYAEQDGGAILVQSGRPVIRGNRFIANKASGHSAYGYGGGLANRAGSPLIEGNLFEGNQIAGTYGPAYGAGLYNGGAAAIIRGNTFRCNSANGYGGGLHNEAQNVRIENNLFVRNEAYYGGGLANNAPPGESPREPLIQNNTFGGNDALYTGGALHLSGWSRIYNNIVAGNAATAGGGVYVENGTPAADYNDVWNNTGGDYAGVEPAPHDLAVDPRFHDSTGGDYHLSGDSPCIDAGAPTQYPASDFEDDPRPLGAGPDIGADEFRSPTHRSSVGHNQNPDHSR